MKGGQKHITVSFMGVADTQALNFNAAIPKTGRMHSSGHICKPIF